MAYLTHLKWTLAGWLGGSHGPEIFSTGFQSDVPDDFAGLPTLSNFNLVRDALSDCWQNAATKIGTWAVWDSLTCALIGPDGHVAVDGTGAFVQRKVIGLDRAGGGSSPTVHPFQIASVLSLMTTRHGPRGKGRMYVPAPCFPVSTNGTIDASLRSASLAQWATCFGSINTVLAADASTGPVAVASSMGETHPVTQLRMGVILDTQRRRRNDLAEDYGVVSI